MLMLKLWSDSVLSLRMLTFVLVTVLRKEGTSNLWSTTRFRVLSLVICMGTNFTDEKSRPREVK